MRKWGKNEIEFKILKQGRDVTRQMIPVYDAEKSYNLDSAIRSQKFKLPKKLDGKSLKYIGLDEHFRE